jgi:hypothetical protein
MVRYIVCAVKYLLAFIVLYLGLLWLSQRVSGVDVPLFDSVMFTLQTTKGKLLVAAVVVLAAMYPKWGFIVRRVECDMTEDREQILAAFHASGFELVAEDGDKMVFHADNVVRRLSFLLEDEICVTQYGQWCEIRGIRRAAARIAYRLDMYMTNKRR